MEGRTRPLFYLLLGASGVMLIVTSHLFRRERRKDILLVAANFHNGSLSYLAALNVNFSHLRRGYQTLSQRVVKQSRTGLSEDVELFRKSEHNSSLKRDFKYMENNENESAIIPLATNINDHSKIHYVSGESSTKEKDPSSGQPGSTEGFVLRSNCSSRETGVEDLLCMSRPNFLPNFRNPCWYQAGKLHCLPYFYIMGVCKTGTTDLFTRMSYHPEIVKNRGVNGKETWFWSWLRYGQKSHRRTKKTLGYFIGMFDSQRLGSGGRRMENGTVYHPLVTGHGDPMDFWDHTSWRLISQNDPRADIPEVTTPKLVRHINPGVKLILILRDPVERLFSHYLHGLFGTNARDFHTDIMTSLTVLNNCTRNMTLKGCLYDKKMHLSLAAPISGSFYSIHLKEWLKVFPRKQMFITRTEDFSSDIAGTLLQVFQFLGLGPMETKQLNRISNMPHVYVSKKKHTSGDVLPETRAVLEKVFRPYNKELAAMLGDQRFDFNRRQS